MKTVIITGAGHKPGLGSFLVQHCLDQGHNVLANSRKFDDAWIQQLDLYKDQTIMMQGDISSSSDRQKIIQSAIVKWGRIDCLINNAITGAATFDPDGRLSNACWIENFQINVISIYQLMLDCQPHLETSQGTVINISSRAGVVAGAGNNLAYAMSKAALNHLTRNMALHFAPEVTVNAICPGLMESQRLMEIFGLDCEEKTADWKKQSPLRSSVRFQDIATQIDSLIQQRSMTGQILSIDCGQSL